MIADLRERLRAFFFPRRWRRELEEEMRFHLEQEESARRRAGTPPDQARREALLAFGGTARYAEETRDATGVRPLTDLYGDVRFALRALRRNPGFALGVILVLSLALGGTTAVFAVVHRVLLAQLPYPHPDRLVRVFEQNSPTNRWPLSAVDVAAIRNQSRTFEAFGAARSNGAALTGLGAPVEVPVTLASAGLFQALGVVAARGRLILAGDERPGSPPVAVVSHAFAAQWLAGAEAALGRTITLDGVSRLVVGVLPPEDDRLAGGMTGGVWLPLQVAPPTRRGPFGFVAIGLLRAGVTMTAAREDLAGISRRIFPLWQAGFRDSVATLTPYSLRETIVGRAAGELWLFAGAVLLLLLVAVVNVATLVLVRTVAREHELAVRAALGATRARLARLVVVEGLLLAGTSGLLGLGIAAAALRLVPHIAPGLPRSSEVALAGTPVLAALLLTVLTGLAIGISPFLLVGRARPIQGSVRRGDPGGKAGLVRRILVAAEFSLVVPLLLAAALLGRSLMELQQVDPGYDAKSTLSVRFSLPQGRYRTPAEAQQFWDRAIRQALETPGIAAAGVGTGSPPDDPGDVNNFNLVAHPVSPGSPEPTSPWTAVTPGYFEALRIPLLEGRMFGPGDSASAPPVAIVSRAWAARYFPGEEVVGQQLIGGGCYQCPRTTIVGVVGDVKYQGLAGNGDGVYTPLQQEEITAATLFVRARGAPAGITRSLTERLAALDPTLPLAPETLAARLRRVFADPGRWTAVVASFAGAALLLAAMGIAGLLSYVVRRQRREIGVRMALGAKPGAVIRMVILRGMGSAVPGSLVGLALALAGARGVASMLYGVGPRDPETALGVVALLLGIALMASLVPALRAVRIRPIEALADD